VSLKTVFSAVAIDKFKQQMAHKGCMGKF